MEQVSSLKLNDGTLIPPIGFGTGTALLGSECTDLIVSALNAGYRHIDSAQMYENAGSIGVALQRWKRGKREDVYITAKCGHEELEEKDWEPRKVLKEQLKLMGTDYVDLYLIHAFKYAKPNIAECWKTMEALKEEGLARSIGVSDFRAEDMEEFRKVWTIPPSVNQIEYQPYCYHMPNMVRLLSLLKVDNIPIAVISALSPFRSPGGPLDPVLRDMAQKYKVSEAQILLAWAKQHSGACTVVTTTQSESRQIDLLSALQVTLAHEDLARIAEAGTGRYFRYAAPFVWDHAQP